MHTMRLGQGWPLAGVSCHVEALSGGLRAIIRNNAPPMTFFLCLFFVLFMHPDTRKER